MSIAQDIGTEAVKAAPPIAVSAWTMNQTVMLLTVIYLALQIFFLVHKHWMAWRADRDRRGGKVPADDGDSDG